MNRRPNKKSRYHTRPKEYHEKQRVYMNEWHKTKEGKAARHRWLKTKAGKAYKARACIRHYHKNREWIANYKIQKGCELCGFNKWPEALDFDHKNPKDKRFNISQALIKSKYLLEIEIKKCIILCANCHRHKSKERNYRG